ncbi:MAG: hypothetical protein P4L92_00950 [Rudaea sp.]|nr:hypothetical protein [Rudaea sp.]
MPSTIPHLQLTHGQVAWSVSLGQTPRQETIDRLRYLRQLGIPFTAKEQGQGRGNTLIYAFDHLIECGVGLFGLRRGMRPADVAEYIVPNRRDLRQAFRDAYLEQPDGALSAPWVKKRGDSRALLKIDRFLRMHDRYREPTGAIETVTFDNAVPGAQLFDQVERYPGEEARLLLPITRMVLELVAWAQEAPEVKRGRQ